MRKFQCFQNTRFLQLTVLFKLVKDEIPDEGRNAQMMRCRVRLNQMLLIICNTKRNGMPRETLIKSQSQILQEFLHTASS